MFVIVLAGPDEVPFGIHKDLICAKSAFFSKHFEAQNNDQLEHVVKLPEVDTEVFGLAQNFIYTDPSSAMMRRRRQATTL